MASERERTAVRVREGATLSVDFTPRSGQTETSVGADVERSLDFGEQLIAGGTEEWCSHYRWIGPAKIMVAKEVGPPPWRLPRGELERRGRHLSVLVGWRMTALRLHVMWTGLGPREAP